VTYQPGGLLLQRLREVQEQYRQYLESTGGSAGASPPKTKKNEDLLRQRVIEAIECAGGTKIDNPGKPDGPPRNSEGSDHEER
jgi:hypothetical protein